MNPADEEAQKPRPLLVPPALDSFGVAELNAYIEALEAEIARVKATISSNRPIAPPPRCSSGSPLNQTPTHSCRLARFWRFANNLRMSSRHPPFFGL